MEPEVLLRFKSGDEEAVKAVYNRYSGAVYALSMSVLRDPGLAADATQQTFVKAWRASQSYDTARPFAPWIYAIARRTAIDIHRKEVRTLPSEEVVIAERGPSLETVWETFRVRSALDQLKDEEREVVRMSHFEGLTHVEIARSLDVPIGTVKSRSHRAHRHLAELLADLSEEPNPSRQRRGER